jgi:hypothetical protein
LTAAGKEELDYLLERPGLLLKEVMHTLQEGIALSNNFFMFDLIDEVIESLQTTGTLQFMKNNHEYQRKVQIVFRMSKHKNFAASQKQLTINDLEYGFVIWLIACAVSIGAFLMEILGFAALKIINWIKRCLKNLLGYILFLIIVKNLINLRRY